MLQIFLNGHEVKIKDGTVVKINIENPLFSTGDQYSLDVELPLKIKQNRDFFGFVDRLDVIKKNLKYDARLSANNREVIRGEAIVTQVTNTAVKVQLLGQTAAYNYAALLDDRYIDQLELGDYMHDDFNDSRPSGAGSALNLLQGEALTAVKGAFAIGPNCGLERPWQMYPIYNESAEVLLNGWRICTKSEWFPNYSLVFLTDLTKDASEAQSCQAVSPQPMLWFMVERIAKATGLEVEYNELKEDSFLKRLFIANASGYSRWNKALPHWTIAEWWQQLEWMFGIVPVVSGNKMSLLRRNQFFSSANKITVIDKVVDEYTAETNSDEQKDTSTGNVGYADFETDPMLLLSDEVLACAKYNYDFKTFNDLCAFANSKPDKEAWLESVGDTIFCCEEEGRQFIFWRNLRDVFTGTAAQAVLGFKDVIPGLVEINQYRPKYNNDNKDVEIELKFVPCQLMEFTPSVGSNSGGMGILKWTEGKYPNEFNTVKILTRPDRADIAKMLPTEDGNIVLCDIISGEEDAPEEDSEGEDLCYLGIAGFSEAIKFSDGTAVMYPQPLRESVGAWFDGGVISSGGNYGFRLNSKPGNYGITELTEFDVKINTKVKYCITFCSDVIPSVGDVFLIHNQKYVCSKLEVNIPAQGADKLITGYFYRL